MSYLDDAPLDRHEPTPAESRPARGPALAAAALVVSGLVAAALWWRGHEKPATPTGERREAAAPHAPTGGAATDAQTAAPAVPARLDGSDALVREMIAALGAHPELARWLVSDDLIRRFVATIVNLSEGASPAGHWREIAPAEPFRAISANGRWLAEPASFRRYDLATDVFASLEPRATAALYRQLHPLFDTAYAEIGDPASSFDATFARAVQNLLAVAVLEQPVELTPRGAGFDFADRDLEERSAAEKHLLRLGPENALRVQAKLRELAAAIESAPS